MSLILLRCINSHFSLVAFSIPTLTLKSLIILCLGVDFFEFILLRIPWVCWMCRFLYILVIIFSNILLVPLSLSPFLALPLYICWYLIVSCRFRRGWPLFFIFSFFLLDYVISISLSSSLLIFFSAYSNLLLTPCSEFFILTP